MSVDEEERQRLVHLDAQPTTTNRLSDQRASSLIAPTLVVLLAFCGVGFYFYDTFHTPPIKDIPRSHSAQPRAAAAPTILISIDGFRHEYLSRMRNDSVTPKKPLAPNLHAIAAEGVHAEGGMQPVVPTKTFPNHWALVTGLYPENSGIVGNTMYDPVKKSWFHLNRYSPDWWYGSPVWQTLRQSRRVVFYPNGTMETLSDNHTTACVFWPGSDVPKHAPDAFWKYDSSISYNARVDRAISLLSGQASDLDHSADFVTLYFEGVDHAGHQHGPHSEQVEAEIKRVDDAIGYLLTKLDGTESAHFNVIIVSDHGMTDISPQRTIDLKSSVSSGTIQDVVVSPMGLFLPMTITADELYTNISAALEASPGHADVYRKDSLPERWHLRESRLITPVVTMASLGWTVEYPHQHLVPDTDKPLQRTAVKTFTDKGNHGFDNIYDDMQALFIAKGPAFRKGAGVKNLRSIDLYEMICRIFRVQPAPNNGSLEITKSSILADDSFS